MAIRALFSSLRRIVEIAKSHVLGTLAHKKKRLGHTRREKLETPPLAGPPQIGAPSQFREKWTPTPQFGHSQTRMCNMDFLRLASLEQVVH